MEIICNSSIDEEVVYYHSHSNFGVGAKKINRPKNLLMSFSPLSFNQHITFSNTIMIPFIKGETSIEDEKNMSENVPDFPKEKRTISLRKENTRTKTESSNNEKNNISTEKKVTRILIENENENDKLDEESNEFTFKKTKNKEKKDALEINPYFLGNQLSPEINGSKNNDSELENKKVKKILDKTQKDLEDMEPLEIRSITSNTENKSKLKQRIKKIHSYNVTKLSKFITLERQDTDKKVRKKTDFRLEPNPNKKSKVRHSDKNLVVYNFKEGSFKRPSINSIKQNNLFKRVKDNNIKTYKASLFNKKSSANLKIEEYSNFNKERRESNDKFYSSKKPGIKYKGVSHKLLNFGFGIESKEEHKLFQRKERRESFKRKELHMQDNNFFFKTKSKKEKYGSISDTKKTKTSTKEEKNKKVKNFLNFESALNNKKNLCKTQFNLFSPNKFTNTQFCGSDYLEYTLDCMEIILKSNSSQKQQKNKVNFNFPKLKGNKTKKIALFDLDETLVHCTGDINMKGETYQHCIEVVLPCNKKSKVGINIRPLWKKTLNLIKKHYHIVVFTASHQAYADAVLNFMDPENKYFKYRLYRNNCSLVDIDGVKFYVKDLDIFDEFYDLKDIIIVDNSVLSFIYHLENGIPIVPYYNEDKDGSLYVVGLYLMHIYKENDLREANKKYINLESFLNEAKNRKDSDSSINEESANADDNSNNSEKNNKIKDIKDNSIKENSNLNNDNNDKTDIVNHTNEKNKRRTSFSIANSQHRLISGSKLINMYYEVNNNRTSSEKKIEEIMEEKSHKSVSIDEDNDINDNKRCKNIANLFFGKRQLTSDDKPLRPKKNAKSNKVLYNYYNVNIIHSNFYDKFNEGEFFIK